MPAAQTIRAFELPELFREVPDRWTIEPLRNVAKFTTGWTPPTGDDSSYDGEQLWANISDLKTKFIGDTAKTISDAAALRSRIAVSPIGSLLFSFKLSIGHVAIVSREMYTNEAIATFKDTKSLSMAFAYYALPIWLVQNANENIYGAKLLNAQLMRAAKVAVPPRDEQRQIAEYLDRETGKIDELITKQEQLVERLDERRQSVISLTVCMGLKGPDSANTRNNWFPVIPRGWKAGAVKHYTLRITDGAHISPDTDGGVYDFVSTKDVTPDGIYFDGALKTTPETYEYMVRTGCRPGLGDVLLSKDGTIGRTTVVVDDRDFVVASSLIIISPDASRLNSMFLNYLFQTSPVQEQIRSFVKGAGLPRLSIANLLRVTGLIPSIEEQVEIVNYLDREMAAIRALVESAKSVTLLLRERRAALVSAAVTGKIDVRGL